MREALREPGEVFLLCHSVGPDAICRVERVDAGSAVQSVLFPAAGFDCDFYSCSFAALTRVAAAPEDFGRAHGP